MKCEIIRDLLPSYIDELTSTESNELIEEHIEQCEECRLFLEETRKDIVVDKIHNEKEIEPFLKIKEKIARIILFVVIITAMISAFVYDSWYSYTHNGRSTISEEVEIKLEESNGVQMLVFEPVDDDVIFELGYGSYNINVNGEIPVRTLGAIKRKKHPKYYPVSDNKYMFVFIDDDTILDLFAYPEIREISEEDFFAIVFDDCTKVIKLSDLREGKLIMKEVENIK